MYPKIAFAILKPSSILLECREMIEVLEKNRKKLENKKRRGIWTCARPVTQVVPDRKKQTRQQNKQELRRRIREDSNPSYFYESLINVEGL